MSVNYQKERNILFTEKEDMHMDIGNKLIKKVMTFLKLIIWQSFHYKLTTQEPTTNP